ncbi:MAG: hypothetical protein EMLJLAPB_01156 [Candidatus Argoarchaeum ethanivorans]|uniref:Uncharacterized protein n=1 Tax=Candidatus Argoarchaeum ethanivorans TaxID=2608793 RepID=A0A811TJP7_9EURY|nr:MAG: hypothetical protein EMLJLAPB_01156 [Candidatus Argoarchaeum ethanivorans]
MTFLELTSRDIEINVPLLTQVFTGSSTQKDEKSFDYLFSNLTPDQWCPRPYYGLRPVFQIDNMSSIEQILKVRDELSNTKEPYRKDIRSDDLLESTSQLIDKLIGEEDIFQNINKNKLLESISDMISKMAPEQISISKDEFVNRIEKIMALEAMSGILEDFTPEQIDDLETEIKKRPFFK